ETLREGPLYVTYGGPRGRGDQGVRRDVADRAPGQGPAGLIIVAASLRPDSTARPRPCARRRGPGARQRTAPRSSAGHHTRESPKERKKHHETDRIVFRLLRRARLGRRRGRPAGERLVQLAGPHRLRRTDRRDHGRDG